MKYFIRYKNIFLILSMLLIEWLSFYYFNFPLESNIIILILSLITLIISWYKLEYGLLIIIAELIIGVQGHLFIFRYHDWQIPLRIILWGIVMLISLINLKKKEVRQNIQNFIFKKQFLLLFAFIFLGIISALLYHNNLKNIFFDVNAWFYFALLLPILLVYHNNKLKSDHLFNIIFISSLWVGIKTLIFLFIFTHSLPIQADVYHWLRKSIMGEMTATTTGWPRIFIQSQIFPIIIYFFFFYHEILKNKVKDWNYKYIFLASISFSTLLISFSRSFWLAFVLSLGIAIIFIWKKYGFKKVLKSILWFIISIIISTLTIYLISIIPVTHSTGFKINVVNRVVNKEEAAVKSRWALWPALMKEIKKKPIIGHGYGTTITYISSDPRVLSNNKEGKYTTYAFEWGYLDIWLKIGLLGLLSYLYLLFSLFKDNYREFKRKNDIILFTTFFSLIFIIITNFFTPYLNHPLGIMIILLSSCLISKNRVY